MKIISPSHQYIDSRNIPASRFLELIGRTCYKSEDKMTETSADKFAHNIYKSGHYSILEHYWVHLVFKCTDFLDKFISETLAEEIKMFFGITGESYTDFFRFVQITRGKHHLYVSAPLRVFVELDDITPFAFGSKAFGIQSLPLVHLPLLNDVWEILKHDYPFIDWKVPSCENENTSILSSSFGEFCSYFKQENFTEWELMKHIPHTFKIVCDRGVSHELVRHRLCSFAQESTRYCNYSQEKFGKEITVIKPFFFNPVTFTDNGIEKDSIYYDWKSACEYAEKIYFKLLESGVTPEQARTVLPNSLKTEIVMTANEREWQHIIDLRLKGTTGKPHPQMQEVMSPIYWVLREESENRIE